MKEEFVTYDTASALKELGFNEPCFMYIDDEGDLINDDTAEWLRAVKAPLKQQVFRWFREKHNLLSLVFKDEIHYWFEIERDIRQECTSKGFKTYEEAESACIDKLIEIVKKEIV